MRKIVIAGAAGFSNIGDDAILISMLEGLKKEIGEAEFSVIGGNLDLPISKDVQRIVHTDEAKIFQAISQADLVIVGGGGLFYDCNFHLNVNDFFKGRHYGILFFLYLALLAKMLGKPVMLYGVGIGPLLLPSTRRLVSFVLNRMDVISLRDAESSMELKRLRVNSPEIAVTVDPAIGLTPAPKERVVEILREKKISLEKPLIGINVRPWYHYHGFRSHRMQEKHNWYKRTMVRVADFLVQKFDSEIIFLPMQRLYDDDHQLCRELVEEMRFKERAKILSDSYNPHEIKGIVGRLDLVIGTRLHSAIFAASMGTPIIGIIYDGKVRSFLQLIGQEERSLSINGIHFERLCEIIDEVWTSRWRIPSDLRVKTEQLFKKAEENPKLAAKLLRGQ